MKENSQFAAEWRKRKKAKGWKQVSLLVPDKEMALRLQLYRWLLMQQFKRAELIREECD